MAKKAVKKYNGRIQIRTSSSLHRKLVQEAEKENVSLNLYINNLLASNTEKENKSVRTSSRS